MNQQVHAYFVGKINLD